MGFSPEDLREAWASLPEPQSHLSEAVLAGFLRRGGEEAEAHLAACRSCRQALVRGHARREVGRKRLWIPLAAAAALLAAVLLERTLFPSRLPAPPGSSGAAAAVSQESPPLLPRPGGIWTAGREDAEAVLGEAALATLKAGGRVKMGETLARLALEAGALHLDSRGEPLILDAGALEVSMKEGTLVAEIVPPSPVPFAWLCGEALGEEGPGPVPVRIKILRGTAEVRVGSASRRLAKGETARCEGKALLTDAGSFWEPASWRDLGEGMRVLRDREETLLASPPASGYLLDALVRKRRASAEVGLLFEAAGSGWEVAAGQNVLGDGEGWSRLRLEVRPGWCRVSVGARDLFSRPPSGLEGRLLKTSPRGVALKAWGGEVDMKEAHWRPLP